MQRERERERERDKKRPITCWSSTFETCKDAELQALSAFSQDTQKCDISEQMKNEQRTGIKWDYRFQRGSEIAQWVLK